MNISGTLLCVSSLMRTPNKISWVAHELWAAVTALCPIAGSPNQWFSALNRNNLPTCQFKYGWKKPYKQKNPQPISRKILTARNSVLGSVRVTAAVLWAGLCCDLGKAVHGGIHIPLLLPLYLTFLQCKGRGEKTAVTSFRGHSYLQLGYHDIMVIFSWDTVTLWYEGHLSPVWSWAAVIIIIKKIASLKETDMHLCSQNDWKVIKHIFSQAGFEIDSCLHFCETTHPIHLPIQIIISPFSAIWSYELF